MADNFEFEIIGNDSFSDTFTTLESETDASVRELERLQAQFDALAKSPGLKNLSAGDRAGVQAGLAGLNEEIDALLESTQRIKTELGGLSDLGILEGDAEMDPAQLEDYKRELESVQAATAALKDVAGSTEDAMSDLGGEGKRETRGWMEDITQLAAKWYLVERGMRMVQSAWSSLSESVNAAAMRENFERLAGQMNITTAEMEAYYAASSDVMTTNEAAAAGMAALYGRTADVAEVFGDNLATLSDLAEAIARLDPGTSSAAEGMKKLADAIATGNEDALRQMSIVVDLDQAMLDYARETGQLVIDLDEAERAQAAMNAVAGAAPGIIGSVSGAANDLADEMDSARTKIIEAKEALIEFLLLAGAPVLEDLGIGFKQLTAGLSGDDLTVAVEQLRYLNDEKDKILEDFDKAEPGTAKYEYLRRGLNNIEQTIFDTKKRVVEAATETTLAGQSVAIPENLISSFYISGDVTQFLKDIGAIDWGAYQQGAQSAADATGNWSNALAGLSNLTGKTGNAAGPPSVDTAKWESDFNSAVGRAEGMIAGLGDQLSSGLAQSLFEQAEEGLRAVQAALEAGTITTELEAGRQRQIVLNNLDRQLDAYRQHTAQISDEYRELKSILDDVTKPSFDVKGLAPDLLGGREDEIDEDYRRLAAVALRGQEELDKHAEDWADTFAEIPEDVKQRGIDAIKEWAKEKVLAYDKGLDFSLLDKDKIVQKVQEAMDANKAKDALYKEIAGMMGVSEFEVALSLGDPDAQAEKDAKTQADAFGKAAKDSLQDIQIAPQLTLPDDVVIEQGKKVASNLATPITELDWADIIAGSIEAMVEKDTDRLLAAGQAMGEPLAEGAAASFAAKIVPLIVQGVADAVQ